MRLQTTVQVCLLMQMEAWFTNGSNTASPTDIPENSTVAIDQYPHKAGNVIFHEDTPGAGVSFYTANANMMGTLKTTGATAYAAGSVINVQDVYVSIGNAHEGLWSDSAAYTTGETVVHGIGPDRRLYQALGASTGTEPAKGGNANWDDLGAVNSSSSWTGAAGVANVDALVKDKDNVDYWTRSIWQLGEPDTTNGGRDDVTDSFTNLDNTLRWTKSHYTHLIDQTVGTSYSRGDNIMYQGQNYVYVSDLPSHSQNYGGSDGYTNFGDLLRQQAVMLSPVYVDTRGGGGSADAPSDVYFRPDEDLEFVDRLPTGEVRTAGAARRTDSPIPPGDGLYNSADDAFYGGLQAGNDGLYGTMDDYYEAESFTSDAQGSPNIDADADNNKELLDTSNTLADFSVADFVDFIQTLANVRAVNGGTMSRLSYAERILEENEINLGAAHSRIMDTDMAYESTKMARQNVLLQAAASMVTQANQLNAVVLSLLQ